MGDKLLQMLGLARKAAKLTFGLDACVKTVIDKESQLILTANDASERTVLTLQRICEEHRIKLIKVDYTMEQLGAGIGRRSVAAVAIHGESFTKLVKEICSTNGRKI